MPTKMKKDWGYGEEYCVPTDNFNVEFPMVKWEDEKPWLIEALKNLEVVEEYE